MEESKINKLAQIQKVNPIAGGLGSWPAIPNICNNLKSPREYEIKLILCLYPQSNYIRHRTIEHQCSLIVPRVTLICNLVRNHQPLYLLMRRQEVGRGNFSIYGHLCLNFSRCYLHGLRQVNQTL